jgi:maltose O-acetyltransferase
MIKKILNEIRLKRFFFLCVYYVFLRYLPRSSFPFIGKPSNWLRYWCCQKIFKYSGKKLTIERMAFFGSGMGIEIGDNSGIGRNCHIPSNTIIGKNVLIGPNLYIHGRNHAFEDPNIPIIEQKFKPCQQTIIEDDVWIGRDCAFTPGRRIKKGIVVATRSVVTKDFNEMSVIGGNPAKVIKSREVRT